jgi:integrase/recombinase XerD
MRFIRPSEVLRMIGVSRTTLRSARVLWAVPHTLRHTTAMHLLQSGVDMTAIALWLGHDTPATTHLYVEADLTQ